MNRLLIAFCAGAVVLGSASAFADDKTPPDVTSAEQAEMKAEADAKKAATAKMTPEQKIAARKARDAKAQKDQDSIIKITQNPGDSRNMGINKSAAASKAGPTPPRGTINTPEAEAKLLTQKGQ